MNPDLIANRLNSVFWPVSFKVVISKLLLCKQTEFICFFFCRMLLHLVYVVVGLFVLSGGYFPWREAYCSR